VFALVTGGDSTVLTQKAGCGRHLQSTVNPSLRLVWVQRFASSCSAAAQLSADSAVESMSYTNIVQAILQTQVRE